MGKLTSHTADKSLSPLGISDGFVSGWAFDSLRTTLTIVLMVDGKEQSKGLTGYPVADDFYAHYTPPTAQCGFKLPLPKIALDGFAHQLSIKVYEWRATASAPTATLSYYHGICFGEVTYTPSGYIEGWVGFRSAIESSSLPTVTVGQKDKAQYAINLTYTQTSANHEYQVMGKFRVSQSQFTDLDHPVFSCLGAKLRHQQNNVASKFIGQVDAIDDQGIHGWILNSTNPLETVNLVLVVDGLPLTPIRPNTRRNNIATELGLLPEEIGLSGFHIDIPSQLKDGLPHTVSVHCLKDGSLLNNQQLHYQHDQPYITLAQAQDLLDKPAIPKEKHQIHTDNPIVSVIILNRNGAACLEALFDSWQRYNTIPVELIVINHASTDDSLNVLEHWTNRLPLKIVQLDHNDSFSASSNRGARLAKAPYVLFLNNDIILLQDILPGLLHTLDNPEVGVVGLKLLKTHVNETGDQHSISLTPVQHLGVRYTLVEEQYWPYEVTPDNGLTEEEYSTQDVPIVTGAFMLCRRDEFLSIGGFDEGYVYGYEDVEFCLRVGAQQSHRIVCRNDLVALHHHGYTRLTGREPKMIDHQINNQTRLAKQLGLWAKRQYWDSLVSANNLFSNEALTIGFAIQYPLELASHKPQLEIAVALAEGIHSQYPKIKPVFLSADQGWESLDGIHVLIAISPYFDLRNIKRARADLRTAFYILDERALDTWAVNPSLDLFDDCLCVDQSLADKAVKLMPQWAKPSVISNTEPLGNILKSTRLRIQLQLADDTPELNQTAEIITKILKTQDALVSISTNKPIVADVIIYIHGNGTPLVQKRLPYQRREDVINILWLLEDAESILASELAEADHIWSALTQWPKNSTPKPKNLKSVKPSHQSMQGLVEHLQLIVEEKVGNTFHTS